MLVISPARGWYLTVVEVGRYTVPPHPPVSICFGVPRPELEEEELELEEELEEELELDDELDEEELDDELDGRALVLEELLELELELDEELDDELDEDDDELLSELVDDEELSSTLFQRALNLRSPDPVLTTA